MMYGWKDIACERKAFKLQKRIYQVLLDESLRQKGANDKGQIAEEPDEVKVSSPVLKPSGGGDPIT
jgi:hypothetical protein